MRFQCLYNATTTSVFRFLMFAIFTYSYSQAIAKVSNLCFFATDFTLSNRNSLKYLFSCNNHGSLILKENVVFLNK